MHGGRASDSSLGPRKRPHHVRGGGQAPTAEAVEGRELAKGKAVEHTRVRTPRRSALHRALDRRRAAARRSVRPLTALGPHGDEVERLREASTGLNREAAPGGDGQTGTA